MYLNEFSTTDNFDSLGKAKQFCVHILSFEPHSDNLDVFLLAGSILIAASYAIHSQV